MHYMSWETVHSDSDVYTKYKRILLNVHRRVNKPK